MGSDKPMMIDLKGGPRLACRSVGAGPLPIVFVHGYSLSLESWDRVIALLPQRYRGYAYDLRGFGRSDRAESYSLDDHARDLLALMDALDLDSAILIGHSLGASIGQMLAVSTPERFKALVFSDGLSRTLPPPDYEAGRVDERMKAYGTAEDNRKVLESRVPGYFDPANVTAGDIARFVDLGLRADTEALRQTLHSIYTHPAIPDDRFGRVRAPVLFVAGTTDRLTPIELSKPISKGLPQAEFATIEGAGHTPMWEKAKEWSRCVYGFLDRVL